MALSRLARDYQARIRHYRDHGPDPEVADAYEAGLSGIPPRYSRGSKRMAAYVAARINVTLGKAERTQPDLFDGE